MPNAFYGKLKNNSIYLDKNETSHLKIVRKNIGDTIDVFTGDGNIYNCIIESIKKKESILSIINTIKFKKEFNPNINLYVGMSKWEKMREIIEKAVELRVNSINIFKGKKSQLSYKNIEKFKKIIIEACKQSYLPLFPNLNFIEFQEIPIIDSIVFDFNNTYDFKSEIKKINKSINLIFGPDMGFSNEEKQFFSEKNFKITNLGNTVFRIETAVTYVLSTINYEFNRLNPIK
ncbi:hypothetical protein OSSY52_22840 [Tepiditoga spiralis]|uniref:Ribosomal RNA small subunit methyltransferase E n=1 Tax=Tepiditoga spiralis TaxID=2108365 RepID=A0A7G1GAH7_9BACT|nr:RsmE family RNA methyltransferase [Tepiditoga spiralis]BBE32143.1 hypothetical protein OSSY52_22840 [Tepiditoga spiralis]